MAHTEAKYFKKIGLTYLQSEKIDLLTNFFYREIFFDCQIQGLNYETQFFNIFLMADHYVGAFLLLPLSISQMCVAFFTSNSFAAIVFLKISGIESMRFRENTVGCDLPPTENTLFQSYSMAYYFKLKTMKICLQRIQTTTKYIQPLCF